MKDLRRLFYPLWIPLGTGAICLVGIWPAAANADPKTLSDGRPTTSAELGNEVVLPIGPGKEAVFKTGFNSEESVSVRPSNRPLSADQFPKIDMTSILSRKECQTEYARKVIKQVTDVYEKLNVPGSPGFEAGLTAVRLYAVSVLTDDDAGDCLFQIAYYYASLAIQEGSRDILVLALRGAFALLISEATTTFESTEYSNEILALQTSEYPPLLKLHAAFLAVQVFSRYVDNQADWGMKPNDPRYYIPWLLDAEVKAVEEMTAAGAPTESIIDCALAVLETTTRDGRTSHDSPQSFNGAKRDVYEKKLYEALIRSKATPEIADTLKIWVLNQRAWEARGTGWASEVDAESSQKFSKLLLAARTLIIEGEKKYPNSWRIPSSMLDVGLGLGMSRDEMEASFQRILRAKPDSHMAYRQKLWYLQRRWYGSRGDILKVSKECMESGRWEDRLPLLVVYGVDLLKKDEPEIYQEPDIRRMVDNTYREYLRRYPENVQIRTEYLVFLRDRQDWKAVGEQLAKLGNFWNLQEISRWEYADLLRKNQNP